MKITMSSPVSAHLALTQRIWPLIKGRLIDGKRVVVEIKNETRSANQNALLHAVLREISTQLNWYGKSLDVDTWRRLCVASWLRESKQTPEMIPALDGSGFDVIYERTSRLTVKQCADLIEWCLAFAADNGVSIPDNDNL